MDDDKYLTKRERVTLWTILVGCIAMPWLYPSRPVWVDVVALVVITSAAVGAWLLVRERRGKQ